MSLPSTPILWSFDDSGFNAGLFPASLTACDHAWLVCGAILLGTKASCTPAPADPNWQAGSTSWNCSVRTVLGSFRTRFTMGAYYKGEKPQLDHILASMWCDAVIARDYPSAQELMLAGIVGSSDTGEDPRETFKKAELFLRESRSARDKLERAFGPFSHNLLPKAAAHTALDLLKFHPEIDALKAGKPLGVLEIAAASCANDVLCHLLTVCDYPTERLAAAAMFCGVGTHSRKDKEHSSSILFSAIEARALQAELPLLAPLSAQPPPPRKNLKL